MPLFTPELEFSDDYPTIEPSLKLDFANARALDPRITFERASTATYVGRDGLIKTADEDEPRFDHDPETGESLGLLIEESRTNLCVNSTASNSWGTPFQLIQLGTKTEVAPTGEVDAFHWIETEDSTTHLNNGPTISITSGNSYSISAFFKKISGSISRGYFLQWYKSGGQTVKVTYVPSTDTISTSNSNGASAPTNVSVVTYPNGWYKISFTAALAETSALAIVGVADSNGNSNFTGDLSMRHSFWGLQYEAGSFPTSYIPTSGSTATRSTDVARILGESFKSFHNYTEHSLLVDYVLDKNAQLKSPLGINGVRFSDAGSGGTNGPNGYSLRVVSDPTSPQIDSHAFYDFTVYFDSVGFNLSDGVNEYKVAMGFALNNQAFVSGSTVQTDTSVLLPNPQTVLIERLIIGNLPTKVHYKKIVYYPKRLTNTQLQTLTQ